MFFIEFFLLETFSGKSESFDIYLFQSSFEGELFRLPEYGGNSIDWIADHMDSTSQGVDSEDISIAAFTRVKKRSRGQERLWCYANEGDISLDQGRFGGTGFDEQDMVCIGQDKETCDY